MKLFIALVLLLAVMDVQAEKIYTEVTKFTTYNHPDGRSCMIQFYLKYDYSSGAYAGAQLWNGTMGNSMYHEVFMGNNPFAPSSGERDVNCAYF